MKKLILTYLTLPVLFSGATMALNQPELQKINFVDEQKIAQAHKSCQWQVTKDRAVSAIIVAAIIGGACYYFGQRNKAATPGIQAPVVPAANTASVVSQAPLTIEDLLAPIQGLSRTLKISDAAGANLGYLYTIQKHNEQLSKKLDQLSAQPLPQMNLLDMAKAYFTQAVAAGVGSLALIKGIPLAFIPLEGSLGYLQPVNLFIKNKTHFKDARALVLKDSYFCKAYGYDAYYLQALTNSINANIDQLALVLGYMSYSADKFKSQKNESAYQQAQSIKQHVVTMTNTFAQQMNEVLVSESKSRLHDVVARYLDQLDTEVDRFDELIYNS